MLQFTLKLPGGFEISPPPGLRGEFQTLGDLISGLLNIAFMVAFFLAFFWMVWGAFHYIFAGGNKEELAKARSRITWAIVGLIILALSFAIAQFAEEIFKPTTPSPLSRLITPAYAVSATPMPTLSPVNIRDIFGFGNISSLGEGTSLLVIPAFSIAFVGVTVFIVVGAFRFLASGGDKESIAKARGMITHAIIGFLILMFIFLILQFIPEFFGFDFSLFQ